MDTANKQISSALEFSSLSAIEQAAPVSAETTPAPATEAPVEQPDDRPDQPIERHSSEWRAKSFAEEAEAEEAIAEHSGFRDAAALAHGLAKTRAGEIEAAEDAFANQLAEAVDWTRADFNGLRPAQADDLTQLQPETVPAVPTADLDPEIAKALENPKIRKAIEAEVRGSEEARRTYVAAVAQLENIATANLVTTFPELSGISGDQIPTALEMIGRQNPQRRAEIESHLTRVVALHNASVNAQAAQAEANQQQFKQFAKKEDARFEDAIKGEPPKTVKAVRGEIVAIAKDVYGVQPEQLKYLYETNPVMRTAEFQRMMFDAARFHIGRNAAKIKVSRDLPPVQRPGVAVPRNNDASIQTLSKKLESTGKIEDAVAVLKARRANRQR